MKDPKNKGYTAFHADFPSVVVQSETIEEINQLLADVFYDIIMNSKIKSVE